MIDEKIHVSGTNDEDWIIPRNSNENAVRGRCKLETSGCESKQLKLSCSWI